jgi:acyl-CoA carboxylase subunit beta
MRSIKGMLGRGGDAAEEAEDAAPQLCISCNVSLEGSRPYERFKVCHACGFHSHLSAQERVSVTLDRGSFREFDRGVTNIDPISFRGPQPYRARIIETQRRTGLSEAVLSGRGMLFGREVVMAVLDFSFLGGSIGVAAGERLARAYERAAARRTAIIVVCSTSGIRMREGLLALMQTPRVLTALQSFESEHLPHIVVLTDPTTGAAYSGFVNRADFLVAEPDALIGHAALREMRAQETEELPEGVHTSEWHLGHGLIDAVVPRSNLRDFLSLLLDSLVSDFRLTSVADTQRRPNTHSVVEAWEQVQLSRHARRPEAVELIHRMTSSFIEVKGDRSGEDDPAVVAGVAIIGGESVMIIGQRHASKNRTGLITASGFRKAARAMRLAARFKLPLITLIDTPGASASVAEEASGLGQAIAHCMDTMLRVEVPTIAVIIGEGNSEAAVAMAVADRVLMLDNAVYEVIRPEDAAKIIYQEESRAGEVAERLRITSHDCMRLGVVDDLVPEPEDGAHVNHDETAQLLRRSLLGALTQVRRRRQKRRLKQRSERYRNIGSTHSWLRGTLERRTAHGMDRIGGAIERIRSRSLGLRGKDDYDDTPEIPV